MIFSKANLQVGEESKPVTESMKPQIAPISVLPTPTWDWQSDKRVGWSIQINLSINPMQSTEGKIQNCLKFDPKIMQMRDTLPLFANTCFMFLCLNLMVI